MVEGEHEYGLVDEDGWKVVRTPKSFEEALVHLHETLKEKTPNKTNDGNTKFLRGIGRSTLYDWNDETSPNHRPEVPKPIHQGGLSGFIEHEIDDYILGLIRARGGASEQ